MPGHRDMEIIGYVLDGELAHQDSMDTEGWLALGTTADSQALVGNRKVRPGNLFSRDAMHFAKCFNRATKTIPNR